MDAWPAVARDLAQHHGVIDRAGLDAAKVRKGELARWVAMRRLERCAPRVWRLVGAPVTWEQRLMAGLLSLGPEAVVSHRAAAALHGLDGASDGAVEFSVPRSQRSPRFGGKVHSTTAFVGGDVVTVRGFRVTAATRTLVDLASAGVGTAELATMIDSAVHQQLSAPAVISRRLTALGRRGRHGVRLLDRLLEDAGGHTPLERAFLRLVREAGLPRPSPQVVILDGEHRVGRVDFVFAAADVVVEVSGRVGHSSSAERARDAQRRNELQDVGLTVYEFTRTQVFEQPGQVVRVLRGRLTRLA